MTSKSMISVVLPVYNEADNIGRCLSGLWGVLAEYPHEILVCYDFEEDTTLEAIRSMPRCPPSLKLVRNRLGRGAAQALRTGFATAEGDVIVTSMADLSDPPEAIPAMARKIRGGAVVVSGSRYMPGGSQIGGPWLKTHLSRAAGILLRSIAGLPTYDPTSNFRAYAKTYVSAVEIESRDGFQIALELTVKAHLRGARVDEVPSSWTDRAAGASQFRLWRWLPGYLRWFLVAIAPAAVVVLLALALAAWGLAAGEREVVPVSSVVGLSALAIVLAKLAQRFRGRTLYRDAVYPVLCAATQLPALSGYAGLRVAPLGLAFLLLVGTGKRSGHSTA